MTREEKKEELIGLFLNGAITIGELIDECFEFGQQHPRWISVEDALPEEDGKYLFFSTRGGVQCAYYYKGLTMGRTITHWMPLPQPPSSSEIPNNHKKGGGQ